MGGVANPPAKNLSRMSQLKRWPAVGSFLILAVMVSSSPMPAMAPVITCIAGQRGGVGGVGGLGLLLSGWDGSGARGGGYGQARTAATGELAAKPRGGMVVGCACLPRLTTDDAADNARGTCPTWVVDTGKP